MFFFLGGGAISPNLDLKNTIFTFAKDFPLKKKWSKFARFQRKINALPHSSFIGPLISPK